MTTSYIAIHTKTPALTALYNQLKEQYHALAVSTHDDMIQQRDQPSPALSGGYESIASSSYEALASALARRVLDPVSVILISNNPEMVAAAARLNISTILIAQSHECFANSKGAVSPDIKGAQRLLGEWVSDAHRRSPAYSKLEAV